MSTNRSAAIDRRVFLRGTASAAVMASLPQGAYAVAPAVKEFRLVAAPARLSLVGPPHADTDVWYYGGRVPGPEIRARQGERIRVIVENRLAEETTVHWHGVRVPNAMERFAGHDRPEYRALHDL